MTPYAPSHTKTGIVSAIFIDMVRIWRNLVVALLALLLGAAANAAERRVALVVGVGAYRAVPPLRNTLNDARGIAAALGRLEFDVETVADPDRGALEAAVRRFGNRARTADVALFYYAGHAVEANGRNWLLPVSADVRGGRDLRFEAIELDALLEQLEGGARLSVIILDSCRDNPFRMRLAEGGRGLDRGGLAQVQAAAGTLVVFSTAPGTVAGDGAGPNSPFTTALLKHIEAPGQEIRQMLAEVRRDVREATRGQQVPWEQSAMEGTLYLKPAPEARGSVAAPPRPALETETLFWDSVRSSTNRAELQAYLDRYPNGTFAALATARIGALATPPERPLLARLIAEMPAVDEKARSDTARRYLDARWSKALAISLEGRESWRAADWPTTAIAQERALEGCQVRYGKPCILFATNETIEAKAPSGEWPARDMPRVHYAGPFDPAQIPNFPESRRTSPAVAGYAAAPAPKAMAYHPWGRAFVVAGAASETAAQEQALAACRDDPDRKGADGPCFLYAVGNGVVLPQRLTQPRPAGEPDVATQLIAARPIAGAATWTDAARRYADARQHKALAVLPERGLLYWSAEWASAERAELITLEKCQLAHGEPCRLFALDDRMLTGEQKPRDMPRLRYTGPFQAADIPIVAERTRLSPAVTGYAAATGPKAMTLHPTGLVAAITGAPTQRVAEEQALANCNAEKRAQAGPCFLYASGNQVVLPQRRTEPITPAATPQRRSIADDPH